MTNKQSKTVCTRPCWPRHHFYQSTKVLTGFFG